MNKKLLIEGMSCSHCVKHVESALSEVTGVQSVKVNLKGKFADVVVTYAVDNAKLIAAVDEAGYNVVKIEE